MPMSWMVWRSASRIWSAFRMRIGRNCSIIFAVKHLAIYGACAGLLIVAMRFVEYRFLVLEHSFEIYGALIAAAFAAAGIWLGLTVTKREIVVKEVPIPATEPFEPDTARIAALGLTPRELEVLQLIAEGLSTKEMADRLCAGASSTNRRRSIRLWAPSSTRQSIRGAKSRYGS